MRGGCTKTHRKRVLVTDDISTVDHINQSIVINLLLHRSHLVAVNIVPELDSVLDERLAGKEGEHDGRLRRDHEPSGLHEALTSVQDRVEHALVKEEVALRRDNRVSSVEEREDLTATYHPLGDDHVDLLWQLDVLDLALHDAVDV